ncbi:Rapid alkalinization factor [Arachis hypogaea]|uniref:Rapid ALkalinization Factor n=1 Tax=Arachis hypogaea TaxID=3818 RepID=A0A444YR26_ARAHY|nr:Rapid alkalinization factor [Arachis hypogaea]RYR04426.1 hypothetical protein Ahy_B06g084150 [Arachis hypogaea]
MVTMTAMVVGMRMMSKTIPKSSYNGTIGECMEAKKEFVMDSESIMEIFESKNKVIGNGAIGRDGIPCSKNDNTTKNCSPGPPANRYNRGCSAFNRCRGGGGDGGGSTHG